MSALIPGTNPGFVACALAALLLAGCSSAGTGKYSAYSAVVAEPEKVARAAVDMEADGLPAQTPPARGGRREPDDPNEPYSRNYGGTNPSYRPLEKPVEPSRAPPVRTADGTLPSPSVLRLVSVAVQDIAR